MRRASSSLLLASSLAWRLKFHDPEMFDRGEGKGLSSGADDSVRGEG
jgi:hypothetical protein